VTEQAAVLALVQRARAEWFLVAQLVETTGSARRIIEADFTGLEPPELVAAITDESVTEREIEEFDEMIATLRDEGVSLVTVLDESYPTNLRLIYNRPPFLFIRGDLRSEDDRAICRRGHATSVRRWSATSG
jgi:DNA processing protein